MKQSAWTIITGAPGSGKSTLSALLAANAEAPTIHLHTDSFYSWIKTGFIAPYLPASAHQNEVVLTAITAAAGSYSRGGYDVVIDGVIGPWIVDAYAKQATSAGAVLNYVVLTAPLALLLTRAAKRDEKYLHDPKPITMLHQAFSKLDAFAGNSIDTSQSSPEKLVSLLQEGLINNSFRLKHTDA